MDIFLLYQVVFLVLFKFLHLAQEFKSQEFVHFRQQLLYCIYIKLFLFIFGLCLELPDNHICLFLELPCSSLGLFESKNDQGKLSFCLASYLVISSIMTSYLFLKFYQRLIHPHFRFLLLK